MLDAGPSAHLEPDGVPIEGASSASGGAPATPASRQAQLQQQRHALQRGIARVEAQLASAARRVDTRYEPVSEPAADGDDPDLLAILRGELEQTERALDRLAHGQYGHCEVCGQPIAPARLRIVPSAARCDTCARGTAH